MCRSSSSPNESFGLSWPSSKTHLHKHLHLSLLLIKRRRAIEMKEGRDQRKKKVRSEIEKKNLKLIMENQSIIEENERLRKKAVLLSEENQALLSHLQNKLSQQTIPPN